ncbi:hypothetical protein EPA93_19205 [Ktedonosporobacter rubrisoli]|uniref:Uncharacterized protein n=1 Tax=Ktedonosporobacter rubrisoli TaxID=2509675 RepID=A0A4P6JRC9_KTERU|nr:hypothetical protein [Ktedonosporobacter rubrisoli]QBD78008.1 hypothetical protein EPA93_19205 [Ktedonosporobacter rubrisoli]
MKRVFHVFQDFENEEKCVNCVKLPQPRDLGYYQGEWPTVMMEVSRNQGVSPMTLRTVEIQVQQV